MDGKDLGGRRGSVERSSGGEREGASRWDLGREARGRAQGEPTK